MTKWRPQKLFGHCRRQARICWKRADIQNIPLKVDRFSSESNLECLYLTIIIQNEIPESLQSHAC